MTQLTCYRDGAAHKVYQAFCDAHTKAGALNLVGYRAFLAREGLKNNFQEFLRHANAVIDNRGQNSGMIRHFARQFSNLKAHRTALGRVLYRVVQQIDEHLANTNAVTN